MEGSSRAEIEHAIQYHHPEKTLAALPGGDQGRRVSMSLLIHGPNVEKALWVQ